MNKGKLFIVSGPAGSGKDTLIAEYLKENGSNSHLSVSATTRAPRGHEKDGIDYHFFSIDEFKKLINDDKLLEYAEYCGNFYGTLFEPIENWIEKGDNVLLNIEIQGASQVVSKMPDAVRIFIMPPSLEVLRKRLIGRGTDSEESVAKRLMTAEREMQFAGEYDYTVVNDKLEDAVAELTSIINGK